MPNHVTNILTIKGAEVQKVLDAIRGKDEHDEKNFIDFNKIIPMPESMNIEDGSRTDFGIAILEFRAEGDCEELNKIMQYPWVKNEGITTPKELCEFLLKSGKADLIEGQKALNNKKNYGFKTWYDWACAKWGTKWNAYCQNIELGGSDGIKRSFARITFDTAWTTPLPIFEKLSTMFPKTTFLVDYADEDIGNNCGTLHIKGGVAKVVYVGTGDMKAMIFANKVKGRNLASILEDYINEDVIAEDESSFGNPAFTKELIEHFIETDEQQLKDFIATEQLSEKIFDFIEKVAVKNDAFELAGIVVKRKKELSLILSQNKGNSPLL